MKHKHVCAMPAMVVLIALVLAAPIAHAATCTMASVAGAYGYTTTGTVFVSGVGIPLAAVGVITFESQGSVSGSQTRVVAGTATDETYSGTYTVNSDCKGSFTVTVQPGGRVSTVNVVWIDNAKGARAIFTNPGTVITSTADRL